MTLRYTALERAFELARSGKCASVTEIRRQLRAEGLAQSQVEGPMLTRQLRELCIASVRAKDFGGG
jgi:hypothetical protein